MSRTRFSSFKRSLGASFFLALLWTAPTLRADQEVPFTDPAFQYNGRIDYNEGKGAAITWPGSSVTFRVESPSLELLLKDSKGYNFFSVIVDGKVDEAMVLDLEKGENTVNVDLGSESGPKTVQLIKRNDVFTGATFFQGIKIPDDAKMLTPPERPERRIEFYGDSITVGMGNIAPDNVDDQGQEKMDNYQAYGPITARNLDAEYRIIARSGIGIMVSWFPETMPQIYNRTIPERANSQWDFSQWTPQVVVINLFQNDSWLYNKPKRISPTPTPDDIVAAYKAFVESIRAEYPDAHIVCTLGSMNATKEDKPWPSYIEKAVEELKADGDTNISVLFFPYDGWSKHPRVRHHEKNAELLTAHLKEQMGW